METQARHHGSQALHELERFHNMSGAVFVRTLQLQHDLAGTIAFGRSLAMAGRVI